jgi:hypothetical protein
MPGAMENAGADLYQDNLLVLDDHATTGQKREFGMVVGMNWRTSGSAISSPRLVGRHLAERKLRQLDGLSHRQCLAARSQHRQGRAGGRALAR